MAGVMAIGSAVERKVSRFRDTVEKCGSDAERLRKSMYYPLCKVYTRGARPRHIPFDCLS
jgi:hypothetical protein